MQYFALIFYSVIFIRSTIDAFPLDNNDDKENEYWPFFNVRMIEENLTEIPKGNFSVTAANFAYNRIETLADHVFYNNSYKNLQDIKIGSNVISEVNLNAFCGLNKLKTIDISSNNLSCLESNTFQYNTNLEKLDASFNSLTFDLNAPFLRSQSIKSLIISYNKIRKIFDRTFSKLPNLERIHLNGNSELDYLSKNSFYMLKFIQFISLSQTNVYTLSCNIFLTIPRLIDLTETPLSKKFTPALKKVKSEEQLKKLIKIENFLIDDDDDENMCDL